MRLVNGGSVKHQGRVEVFYNGSWGTVCDDYWDLKDANVVCRQLGFEGAVKDVKYALFGRGNGIIWVENAQCTGHESSITECRWGKSSCSHREDAGVICIPGNSSIQIIVTLVL